jgi:hypothetical protein
LAVGLLDGAPAKALAKLGACPRNVLSYG